MMQITSHWKRVYRIYRRWVIMVNHVSYIGKVSISYAGFYNFDRADLLEEFSLLNQDKVECARVKELFGLVLVVFFYY